MVEVYFLRGISNLGLNQPLNIGVYGLGINKRGNVISGNSTFIFSGSRTSTYSIQGFMYPTSGELEALVFAKFSRSNERSNNIETTSNQWFSLVRPLNSQPQTPFKGTWRTLDHTVGFNYDLSTFLSQTQVPILTHSSVDPNVREISIALTPYRDTTKD